MRAPFTWFPPILDFLGGKLALPEPFGLRHAWADKPWRHRFMADDALRAATPVLRVVHAAAIRVLAENGVDTEQFGTAPGFLSGAVQDPSRGRRTCTTREVGCRVRGARRRPGVGQHLPGVGEELGQHLACGRRPA